MAVFVQAFIDPGNDWNSMRGVAIILGNDVIANDLNQSCLCGREETDGRDVVHAIQNHFTGFRVPELLLCQRAEVRIIAWLTKWTDRFFCMRIIRMVIVVAHRFSLLIMLASRPIKPAAANNNGAKIGGP